MAKSFLHRSYLFLLVKKIVRDEYISADDDIYINILSLGCERFYKIVIPGIIEKNIKLELEFKLPSSSLSLREGLTLKSCRPPTHNF